MSAPALLPGAPPTATGEQTLQAVHPVDPAAPVFAGHYPEFPLLPGVFLLDAVHHAVLRSAAERSSWRLAFVDSVRFLNPVLPGDTLTVEAAVSAVGDGWSVKATCRTDRGKAASLRLRYLDPTARDHQGDA
ncbi:3-hydroxyacyl-ACP dehydratase FabZ family protein [Streptacidiphilus anmyonensis]|uniref:3-hydroxyacyl-ACP dehydratase FabZ family protein n=1 Tax=Streptacidiphilus anmyonensis TaxID=405782 RepID=UPI0006946767|nr:MaoC/PaaZ C-terminal domain-containing protein [Streptacidiphilus anmyonensis]